MSDAPLIIGRRGQLSHALQAALPSAVATSHEEDSELYLDLETLAADAGRVDALLNNFSPSLIYCVGGMTNVDWCQHEPKRALHTNAEGPARLAAAAARAGASFVYFSTDYVFDGRAGPYDEDAAPNPLNAYGISKHQGEIGVLAAHAGALVVRTTGVYGPDPRRMNFVYAVRRALDEGRTLDIPSDQFGTPTYAPDLAAAAMALVASGAHGIINVAGPELLPRDAFARRIVAALGGDHATVRSITTRALQQPAPRPLRAGLCTKKLRQTLPTVTMRTLEPALRAWSEYEPDIMTGPRWL